MVEIYPTESNFNSVNTICISVYPLQSVSESTRQFAAYKIISAAKYTANVVGMFHVVIGLTEFKFVLYLIGIE